MAKQLRFKLDGSIYNGIANPDEFGFTIQEEQTLGYRFVSYNNDLVLIRDAYEYINGLITDSCGCDTVFVEVEYLCQSGWRRLSTGYIILSECTADLDKCTISTSLFDNTFSTLINNNKSIPFSLRSELTKNGESVTPPSYKTTVMYVPATGAYETTDVIYSIRVEDAFKHLVACMTDNLVDCEAPIFASGEYEFTAITNGRQIYTPLTEVETFCTFEQLFLAFQKKINISMSTSLQDNGRPLLTIDSSDNIDSGSINANLLSVAKVRRKQDTARLYSTVTFGSNNVLEQWQCNGGDTACTFAQTPFLGFREETFGLIGKCNKDTDLDLFVTDVIFDTNVIEDIYVWGNQAYDNDVIVIDCEEGLAGRIVAKQGDPYGIGQTVYNAAFNNESNAADWIGGVPNNLQWYIQGFNPVDTITSVAKNDVIGESFEANNVSFTSFSQWNGNFISFNVIISDVNNNWDTNEYTVPYSGIYTAVLTIVRQAGFDPVVGNVDQFAIVRKLNSAGGFIQAVNGVQVTQSYTSFSVCTVTAQIVCEAGDKLVADMSAKTQNGIGVTITIANGFGGVDTSFQISGVPFEPGELQPYNPCDFKRYLYDFEYPLSMAQIESILAEPSSRIRFSRNESILNNITGTINNLTVDSVTRQKAQLTIRSNQAL